MNLNGNVSIFQDKNLKNISMQHKCLMLALHSKVYNLSVNTSCYRLRNNDDRYKPILDYEKQFFSSSEEMLNFKHTIRKMAIYANEEMEAIYKELINKRIEECIDKINKLEFMKLSSFFQKANYDKASAIKFNIVKIQIKNKLGREEIMIH